ncbi:MAG: hypothetical protein KAQ85_09140, partial [Thermodesulfovibrionia bacterium]|nr:hypothetical protein [Thermodesulfovibrionia bacterium]
MNTKNSEILDILREINEVENVQDISKDTKDIEGLIKKQRSNVRDRETGLGNARKNRDKLLKEIGELKQYLPVHVGARTLELRWRLEDKGKAVRKCEKQSEKLKNELENLKKEGKEGAAERKERIGEIVYELELLRASGDPVDYVADTKERLEAELQVMKDELKTELRRTPVRKRTAGEERNIKHRKQKVKEREAELKKITEVEDPSRYVVDIKKELDIKLPKLHDELEEFIKKNKIRVSAKTTDINEAKIRLTELKDEEIEFKTLIETFTGATLFDGGRIGEIKPVMESEDKLLERYDKRVDDLVAELDVFKTDRLIQIGEKKKVVDGIRFDLYELRK